MAYTTDFVHNLGYYFLLHRKHLVGARTPWTSEKDNLEVSPSIVLKGWVYDVGQKSEESLSEEFKTPQ